MAFGSKEWAKEHNRRQRQRHQTSSPAAGDGNVPRKAIEDFIRHWRNLPTSKDVKEVLLDLENLVVACEQKRGN